MNVKARKKSSMSLLVNLCLILYLFYYSYRYIFQYNSENTSPTYSDTPLTFQLLKFIILAALVFAMAVLTACNKIRFAHKVILVWLVYFCLQNSYAFLVTHSISLVTTIICSLVAFFIILHGEYISLKRTDMIIKVFVYFTIIYEIIQLLLYFGTGRLPALAYDTGVFTDVRFGGAWDDPNGFAVLLSLLIPFVFLRFSGVKRFILTLILLGFLLITWSLTGLFAFCGCLLCVVAYNLIIRAKPVKSAYLWGFLVFVLLVIAGMLIFEKQIVDFILTKKESIMQHLAGWNLDGVPLLTYFGITPYDKFTESGTISLLFSGGVVNLAAFYAVGIYAIGCHAGIIERLSPKDKKFPVYVAMAMYEMTLLIASVNLPFFTMFSNMGLYMLFLAITITNRPYEFANFENRRLRFIRRRAYF